MAREFMQTESILIKSNYFFLLQYKKTRIIIIIE
jgi:hypothetical protein